MGRGWGGEGVEELGGVRSPLSTGDGGPPSSDTSFLCAGHTEPERRTEHLLFCERNLQFTAEKKIK